MSLRSRHIVFIHGMAGWGPKDFGGRVSYWGEALAQFGPALAPHEAKCGPFSALHDRACEVFAEIIGARVDYGEKHSREAGHARYARDFSGQAFVPGWSAENPVILVGHSAGALTALKLQKLLADDFWGVGSRADWIEAVVSVAGALNGSLLGYPFCDEKTGRLADLPSAFISRGLDALSRLLGLSTPPFLDFYLDQWIGAGAPALGRLDASRFVASEDNLIYDMSLQGAQKAIDSAQGGCQTFPQTFYFSFVTRATQPSGWFGLPFGAKSEQPGWSADLGHLLMAAYQARRKEFGAPPIAGWGAGELTIDHWRANDGMVSSISQRYPFTAGAHPVGGEGIFTREGLEPGRWYFENIEDAVGMRFDHLDPVHGAPRKASPALQQAHRAFYRKLNALLTRPRLGACAASAKSAPQPQCPLQPE